MPNGALCPKPLSSAFLPPKRAGEAASSRVGTTLLAPARKRSAGKTGVLKPFSGDTDIFITPGYRFNVVDMLMTNFHTCRARP